MNKTKPELIMLRGFIGAGKTTYARNLMLGHPDKYVRVSKEDLRNMMFFGDKEHCEVGGLTYWHGRHSEFGKLVVMLIIKQAFKHGYSVIVDGTNLTERHERFFKDIARNRAKFVTVSINASYEQCKEHNNQREKKTPERNMRMLKENIEECTMDENCKCDDCKTETEFMQTRGARI